MRYMTEKDTSKYSDTQLFRMWEKQNPNKSLDDVGLSFKKDCDNFTKFKYALECCKIKIVKPKAKESNIEDIMSLIGIEVA